MDADLIRTPLFDEHVRLGAKLAPFAGWAMPLEYAGTIAEHSAVRTAVGVFDVSHLGTVFVSGAGAEAAVAATFTNDPAGLTDGASQYTLCCDERGGILDDLIVYRLAADRFMVVPNAANTPTVVGAIEASARDHGAEVEDASTRYAIIAVQGPRSLDLLGDVLGSDPRDVAYLGVRELPEAVGSGWLCRTGYTGEVGAELVVDGPDAVDLLGRLLDAGATPAGLGARDTLRLEMGYPLHGNDIDPTTDPYEAGLGWAVKLDRPAFRGQDALREHKQAGPKRRLLGLRTDSRAIPRRGMTVTNEAAPAGSVTSGTFSPTLRLGIGLAYLDAPLAAGDRVTVDVRGRPADFEVVKPPFVDRDPKAA